MTVPLFEEETEAVLSTVFGILAAAEGDAHQAVEDVVLAQVLLLWLAFAEDESNWYDGDLVTEFADEVAELVIGAQQITGDITESHLRLQVSEMGYDDALPETPIVDLPDSLRLGVEPGDAYQRPVRKARYLVAEGNDLEVVRDIAQARLEAQVATDLQLARVNAAQQVMYRADPKLVTGYRRIIHPELGSVCGLCIAASDRIYQRIEKMELHPACKCTTLPIINGEDPGRFLNAEDLSRIYEAAGDTTETRALSKLRIQVRENGELGRILMADGAEFVSRKQREKQLSAPAAEQRRLSIASQLDKLRAKQAANPSQWYADRIEQLEELAAAS